MCDERMTMVLRDQRNCVQFDLDRIGYLAAGMCLNSDNQLTWVPQKRIGSGYFAIVCPVADW